MTEPLIDRDALRKAIYRDSPVPMTDVAEVTDAVLAYLRDRLTPEALQHLDEYDVECVGTEGLHRRIFGDVIQTRDK